MPVLFVVFLFLLSEKSRADSLPFPITSIPNAVIQNGRTKTKQQIGKERKTATREEKRLSDLPDQFIFFGQKVLSSLTVGYYHTNANFI